MKSVEAPATFKFSATKGSAKLPLASILKILAFKSFNPIYGDITVRNFQHKTDKHLASLLGTGGHHCVFLVTPTASIIPFTRYIRRFFIQRLGRSVDYHLFWFTTPQGYVVCISADNTVRRIIEEFYNNAVARNYIKTAEQLYIGSSAKTLTKTVHEMAGHYKPTPYQRTHGGSVIRNIKQ